MQPLLNIQTRAGLIFFFFFCLFAFMLKSGRVKAQPTLSLSPVLYEVARCPLFGIPVNATTVWTFRTVRYIDCVRQNPKPKLSPKPRLP